MDSSKLLLFFDTNIWPRVLEEYKFQSEISSIYSLPSDFKDKTTINIFLCILPYDFNSLASTR